MIRLFGCCLVCVLGIPTSLVAQTARDPAGSEKAYDDAAAALAKDDWATACPLFELSHRLDPSPGALLSLAACAEHDGKIAKAWSLFRDARSLNADTASETRRAEIERFVTEALGRLDPKVPKLSVDAPKLEGLKVTRDGQDITATLGTSLPLDPGTYRFRAEAPGFSPFEETLTLAESQTRSLTMKLTPLEKSEAEKPIPEEKPAGPGGAPNGPPKGAPEAKSTGLGGLTVGGIIAGGVGLGAVGVSIGLGVVAHSKRTDLTALEGCSFSSDETRATCGPGAFETATELKEEGEPLAVGSTITAFAGGGLFALGVVLIVVDQTQGSTDEKATSFVVPWLSPEGVGATWIGAF